MGYGLRVFELWYSRANRGLFCAAHLQQLGKRENRSRKDEIKAKLARQQAKTEQLFSEMGLQKQELGAAKLRAKSRL